MLNLSEKSINEEINHDYEDSVKIDLSGNSKY